MSRGWWTVGHIRGAPIRLHWTLPLGAFAMGRFAFVPAFWLGFVLLILIHELGHALFVVRYRLGLSEIAVHGVGGYCRHDLSGSRFQEAAVAWGGVLAQLALFLVTEAVLLVVGPLGSPLSQLAYAFTSTNLWIIAFNLIPIEPLDGAKAWPLLGMWWQKRRTNTPARSGFGQRSTVDRELRNLEKLDTNADTETPSQRTERIVREMIARTTQSKDR